MACEGLTKALNYCFTHWRFWILPFLFFGYAITLLVVIPLLFSNCLTKECTSQQRGQLVGGIFALLAIPISLWEIVQHLIHYTKPYLQKHIVRILWMVPIYAVDAWLGLLTPKISIYMNSLRECYEAYVIYNFMIFLLNYLNHEMDLAQNLEMKSQVKHFFPLCCLPSWEMGTEFVHKCKHGILQYTALRPLTSAIALICEVCGVYGEDVYKLNVAFPYIIVVNNLSQFLSMYCLVLFYRANKKELQPMSPIGKFLCIKSVVFFSFFQLVVITILANTGVISDIFEEHDKSNIKTIASGLQNFLICIEMFIAAIAHHYVFSYRAYVDLAADQPNCCAAFNQMWDVSDVSRDFREHIGVMTNTVRSAIPNTKKTHRSTTGGKTTERARLLSLSDSTGYQSGSSGENGGPSTGEPALVVARSASLTLVAGMGAEEEPSLLGGGDSGDNLLALHDDAPLRVGTSRSRTGQM